MKILTKEGLQTLVAQLREAFAPKSHTHTADDIAGLSSGGGDCNYLGEVNSILTRDGTADTYKPGTLCLYGGELYVWAVQPNTAVIVGQPVPYCWVSLGGSGSNSSPVIYTAKVTNDGTSSPIVAESGDWSLYWTCDDAYYYFDLPKNIDPDTLAILITPNKETAISATVETQENIGNWRYPQYRMRLSLYEYGSPRPRISSGDMFSIQITQLS